MKKILVMGLAAVMALGARAVDWDTETRDSGVAIVGVEDASGDVEIPSSIGGKPVVEIAFGAFADCTEITVLRIPASVTYVDEMAFAFCDALTDIYFAGDCPDSPGDVGLYGDTIIHVSETAKGWGDTWCFCPVLRGEPTPPPPLDPPQPTVNGLTIEGGVVTKCETSVTGEVVIPAEYNGKAVTAIGSSAFQSCNEITSVVIPQGVKRIHEGAFRECSKLESIQIPPSVQEIDRYAFANCEKLTSINIPDGIKLIPSGLFMNCYRLSSLRLPDSIESIGALAFQNMSMTEMVMPTNLTTIAYGMFYGCTNLMNVYFPGIQKPEVADYAIKTIFDSEVPADCTVHAPRNCGWENADGTEPQTVWDRPLALYGDLSIHDGIVMNCHQSSDIVTIPSVYRGQLITGIVASAFSDCTNLTDVVMPRELLSIDENVFASCPNLQAVYFPGSQKPSLLRGESIFGSGVPESCTVYVPSGCGWEDETGMPARVWGRALAVAEGETWELDDSNVNRHDSGRRVIFAPVEQSAIRVQPGKTAFLEIPIGGTLVAIGGNAATNHGAGAGIEVPEDSQLYVFGGGRIVALGGDGATGAAGQRGYDGVDENGDYFIPGAGGTSGYGGGGAGAGIGGKGGVGGRSVMTDASSCEKRMVHYHDNPINGNSGTEGGTGGVGLTCGDVYVRGTVSILARGGFGSEFVLEGGGCGERQIHSYLNAFGVEVYIYGSGGGGGGSGGGGCAAASLGGGGGGGGGGGSGGCGLFSEVNEQSLPAEKVAGGQGGFGGGGNGDPALGGVPALRGFSANPGPGGNGGPAGAQGGSGSLFACSTVTLACGERIPEPIDERTVVGSADGLHVENGILFDGTKVYRFFDEILAEIVIPAEVTWIADGAFAACSNLTKITFLGDAPTLEGTLGADPAKCIVIYDARRTGWTDADGAWRTNVGGLTVAVSTYPGDFYWLTRENADGTLTITGLQYAAEKELEVPMTLYGSREDLLNGAKRPVSALAAGLFKPCSELEQLTFKCDADALTMEGSLGLEGFRTVVSVPAGSKGWDDDGDGLWQDCLIVWGDYLESFWLTEEIAGGVAITGTVQRASGRVELPETLGGKSVLKIGKDVFAGCDGLLGLDVPASVVEIAPHAFDGCSALANVVFYGDAPQPLDAPLGLSDNATVWVREDKAGWGLVPGVWRGAHTAYVPGELLFTWEETVGGVKVTGLTLDDLTAVTVPAELDGQKVVEIGADAFKAAKDLKRVSFEGECPFVPGVDVGLDPAKCVVYARYPAVGWPVAEYAPQPSVWQGCRLEFYTHPELFWQTITLDDGTLAIAGTVGAYGDLKGTAILPGSINGTNVTAVAPYAFARYQDLTEVLLHPNITTLGEGAFYKTPIGSLLLSSNMTAVATNALAGCTNLQSVYIASETPPAWLESMGADSSNCIVYAAYDAPGWAPLPREIGGYAVEPCTHLEGFWLTEENADGTVTVTGTAIDPEGPVIVPATVRGKTVNAIGVSAFARRGALTELVLPKTLTAIGADAFAQSPALSNVTFRSAAPSAPEPVGLDPETCTVFAPYGSAGWDYGTSKWQGVPIMWYPAPAEDDERRSHPDAFWRTEANGDGTVAVVGVNGTCEGDVIVPSKIFGQTVTEIGAAFAGCSNVVSVTIPSNVAQIATGAFTDCEALMSLAFAGRPPAVEGSLGLDGEKCVICYDRRYAAEWDDGSGRWQGCWLFGITHDEGFWKTAENPDGTLTVVGSLAAPEGEMVIPPLISNRWVTAVAAGAFSNCTALTALEIAPGIAFVGEDAFAGDTALVKVVLPEGLALGTGAFRDCAVESVVLPSAQTDIPAAAFSNCTKLADVTFPTNLASVGASAFAGCPLESLEFAASLANIGANAFAGCGKLERLRFLGDAPQVPAEGPGLDGNVTFVFVTPGTDGWGDVPGFWQGCPIAYWCDPFGLVTVTNDDGGLTVVGYAGGDPVGALEIPKTIDGLRVTMIGEEAFKNATSLDAVKIPSGVTNIGEFAFVGCDRLTVLTFDGNAPEVEGIGLGLAGEEALVRVREGAKGWGTVPGLWQGLPTVYFGEPMPEFEGELRITAFGPSATEGAFDLTVEATLEGVLVEMPVDLIAESIFVGLTPTDVNTRATVLARPAQDGSTLTFTVRNPDGTAAASFFRIKVAVERGSDGAGTK